MELQKFGKRLKIKTLEFLNLGKVEISEINILKKLKKKLDKILQKI